MLLNDPMLYGATLPYGDFPISSHYSTLFTTPWQQTNPWHTNPQFASQQFTNPQFMNPQFTSPQFTSPQFTNPWQVNPWQMSPWGIAPWQMNPWAMTPWRDVNNYVPHEFGFSPYQQYQNWQPFQMLQQVPPITPWLQRPTPFPQPIPFTQQYNLNRPFCNWQRPTIF